jgi:hypothetical protein
MAVMHSEISMRRNNRRGFTLIEVLVVMKSDLRNLATAEASFFADSTSYVTYDTTKLKFRPTTGVSDPVIVPGAGYWSATITHTRIASLSCGISVSTPNPIVTTAGDGEPACK